MTRPLAAPVEYHGPFYRHWAWWFTLVILALVVFVRLRLLSLPLERDEGEYAYAGQLMLQGIPPYQLAYNMKFPGTYEAYALIMMVFGQTPAGIHFGVLCATTITALMLYRIGRRLCDEISGMVAATTYGVLAASPQLLGLAGHATHFCALFVTAGLCLLWPVGRNLNWKMAAIGGFLFGLAVLMKQHAALFSVWGLAVVSIHCRTQRNVPVFKRFLPCATFGFGVALPLVLTCLVLWHDHVFKQFWFWTIRYAGQYASEVPLAWAPRSFVHGIAQVAAPTPLLWLLALAGLGLVWLPIRFRQTRVPLLGFAVISLLAASPGFYFRRHYFLLTLPAVALCAACAVGAVNQLRRQKTSSAMALPWPLWAFGLILTLHVFAVREIWFQATPVQAVRSIYLGNPFVESEPVSAFIRTNSPPDARVAVLGSEPQIYFLSRRHSATGYIYMYSLMEPQHYADTMQREMIREIEKTAPEYVVAVLVPASWLSNAGSDPRLFDWWLHSYETNFTLLGVVVLNPPGESQYFWGKDISNAPALSNGGMLIYRRTVPPPLGPPPAR